MFVVCFHISKLCMPISVDINGHNMNGNIKNIHNIYAAFGMVVCCSWIQHGNKIKHTEQW